MTSDHMKSTENKLWAQLRDAGVSVLLSSQREGGLWSYPSSDFDHSLLYAPDDSEELEARKRETFGHASITVSWVALEALAAAFGRDPPLPKSPTRALKANRFDSGAYGSLIARAGAPPYVNESAKHTASSILLQFSVSESSAESSDLLRSLDWLANPTSQVVGGGWPYANNEKGRGLGPMTTAACIAALCQGHKRLGHSMPTDLKSNLVHAVQRGFEAITAGKTDAIWDGFDSEGLPQATRVGDSAFILWLLGLALTSDLALFVPEAGKTVDGLRRKLLRDGPDDGWPARESAGTISISATICVLQALTAFSARHRPAEKQRIQRAEAVVLELLSAPDSWKSLRVWDWAMLTELATARAGPISESSALGLARTLESIRKRSANHRPIAGLLRKLPETSWAPIRYIRFRGLVEPEPSGRLDEWYNSLTPLQQQLLFLAIATALSVVTALAMGVLG